MIESTKACVCVCNVTWIVPPAEMQQRKIGSFWSIIGSSLVTAGSSSPKASWDVVMYTMNNHTYNVMRV